MSDYAHYKRVCIRELVLHGEVIGEECAAEGKHLPYLPKTLMRNGEERWKCWLAESMHWTLTELELGRSKTALRGMLQCADYAARLGGMWPHPSMADAFLTLRNAFEDRLVGAKV